MVEVHLPVCKGHLQFHRNSRICLFTYVIILVERADFLFTLLLCNIHLSIILEDSVQTSGEFHYFTMAIVDYIFTCKLTVNCVYYICCIVKANASPSVFITTCHEVLLVENFVALLS